MLVGRTDEKANRFIDSNIAPAHPLGRVGEPHEVAAAIAFLCSDKSAWTTGMRAHFAVLLAPMQRNRHCVT